MIFERKKKQKLVVGQVDNNVGVGKDSKEDEDGRRANLWDYQVETAGLQSGSTGNESGGHCCEFTSMMEMSIIQITTWLTSGYI